MQLMPAPQTTATPQPRSVPARRRATVSLPTEIRSAQPRALASCLQLELLGGEVDARQEELPDLGHRPPVAPLQAGLLDRFVEELLEHAEAAADPEVVRRAERAPHERAHVAVRSRRAQGASSSCRRRRRARSASSRGHRPLRREQPLDELLVQRMLADQRMREQRLARDRRRHRSPRPARPAARTQRRAASGRAARAQAGAAAAGRAGRPRRVPAPRRRRRRRGRRACRCCARPPRGRRRRR